MRYYFLEHFRIVGSYIGEYFSVQFYICFFELIDEFGVGEAIIPGGSVYFYLPEPAEISLFLFPVGELMSSGVKQRFLGLAIFGGAGPLKTLRAFQQSFSSLICCYSSFNSWHDDFVSNCSSTSSELLDRGLHISCYQGF